MGLIAHPGYIAEGGVLIVRYTSLWKISYIQYYYFTFNFLRASYSLHLAWLIIRRLETNRPVPPLWRRAGGLTRKSQQIPTPKRITSRLIYICIYILQPRSQFCHGQSTGGMIVHRLNSHPIYHIREVNLRVLVNKKGHPSTREHPEQVWP